MYFLRVPNIKTEVSILDLILNGKAHSSHVTRCITFKARSQSTNNTPCLPSMLSGREVRCNEATQMILVTRLTACIQDLTFSFSGCGGGAGTLV